MAKNKQNPLLAAFEAKKEAEFMGRLACNTEINMMAMLIAGNDLGFIAEKRADLLLAEVIEVKMKIADDLLKDAENDKDLTYTKADLARRVKQILGPDGWNRCKQLFPLLRDYWDD
jgi:hypothetical protein